MRAQEDFGWHLGAVQRAYERSVASLFDGLPHRTRCYQILSEAVHGDQPTQATLAAHLGIDRTVLTYVIDDLVSAGLVERRPSPDDRRARQVVGTERGAQVLADLERKVRAAEDELMDGLTADERSAFRALLRRVACGVRHEERALSPG